MSAVLFAVILIEGYVVLATELLMIRQSLPFVGSGVETVAVIISAVLLPLAFGYDYGGKRYASGAQGHSIFSIRRCLIRNFTIAGAILSLGLPHILMDFFYGLMADMGLTHRVLQVTLHSLIFLVYPVFLLGQTVPLITNYFRKSAFAEMTGRVLFFSTAGSFLGSIVSTLALMAWLGVGMTIIVTHALLLIATGLLTPVSQRRLCYPAIVAWGVTIFFNSPMTLQAVGIVSDNAYTTIRIIDIPEQQARILEMNRSGAAKYAESEENLFPYQYYIDENFIEPLGSSGPPKEVLVIGAGGFIAGLDDGYNHYTFVDIDPELKEITEARLHRKPLSANKDFFPGPARAFISRDETQYDLIILDVYTHLYSIPPHLITVEFFTVLKERLKPDGVLVANIVTSPHFRERFAVILDNTFRRVFPLYSRQVIQSYDPWDTDPKRLRNVIYAYYNGTYEDTVYTDDRNTLLMDRAM